jgi:hypothetical protein
MRLKTVTIFSLIIVLGVLTVPFVIHAQGYQLLVDDLPFVNNAGGGKLDVYLNAFFKLGVGIAVLLAVLMFVYNGVQYMTSDIIGKKEEAKKAFLNIAGGLVLIFGSYLILNQINPALVNFNLFTTIEKVKTCLSNPYAVECGGTGQPPAPTPTPSPTTPPTAPDGSFSFESTMISAQTGGESSQLNALISCMATKAPGNVGIISSISDCQIIGNCNDPTKPKRTWAECASGLCQHEKGSAHYGGTSCIGKSYAVDFNDEQNFSALSSAATACDSSASAQIDTNAGGSGIHVHISVGPQQCR